MQTTGCICSSVSLKKLDILENEEEIQPQTKISAIYCFSLLFNPNQQKEMLLGGIFCEKKVLSGAEIHG